MANKPFYAAILACGVIFATFNIAHAANNRGVIIGIDRHRSVVMAEDKDAGRRFLFAVKNRLWLGTLKRGETVWADFDRMLVFASPACNEQPCQIVVLSRSQRP